LRLSSALLSTWIDIDTDPALEALYDELVPVLVLDGVELCHYRLDEARVRSALLKRAPGTPGNEVSHAKSLSNRTFPVKSAVSPPFRLK
jgi:hypothetical protein